jgi:N-acetyl-alpha-D-muramate 1-phosphate uridylyltransferase
MNLYPILILAGGIASRIRPLTEHLPKALIEIAGEPFIIHQLRLFKKAGFKDIVISLQYLGKQIEDYLGDGQAFGLNIQYSYDGEKPLGTAGAIQKALALLPETFFVIYGDSYLPCPYQAIQADFQNQNKPALMTIYRNEGRWDSSNVDYSNQQIQTYDKVHRTENMQYIDYGLEIFSKRVFDHLKANTVYDLTQLFQDLLKKKQLAAFEVKERFYEIGSFAGIEELGYYLSRNKDFVE